MKKIFVASLIFGFGTLFSFGTAEAFKEEANESPFSYSNKKQVENKLEDAIYRRYRNRRAKHFIRNGVTKSRTYQKAIHKLSKKNVNVNERSTQSLREGELKNVPYYGLLRKHSKPSMIRKNQKQVFRKRAINYYVEGGNAGTEALQEGVIYGSQHRVKRIPDSYFTKGQDAETMLSIRDIQRQLYSGEKVGAGQQRQRALNKGNSYRDFMHPFMPEGFGE